MTPEKAFRLPLNLRKLSIEQRRERLAEVGVTGAELDATGGELLSLADVMVESALGLMPVPLGVATGFLIDHRTVDVPMATEEPSVIAAATFGARLVRRSGGFATAASDPVMTGEILLEETRPNAADRILESRGSIREILEAALPRLVDRGGGFSDLEAHLLEKTGLLRVLIHLDVQDAMGANLLNTASEALAPRLEEISGGRVLMAIISNRASRRLGRASFSLDPAALAMGGLDGVVVARRIVLASDLAQEDPYRAVTHNKGIMNGITALALATANDTRGIEAAAHMHASVGGAYRGLSTYRLEGGRLVGELELPLPMATVGGGVTVHPAAQAALKILGRPDSRGLTRIAAALGLAQNLAALRALVAEGIQAGHMPHHAQRLAYQAGARGPEIRIVAGRLAQDGVYNLSRAEDHLKGLREERK